MIAELINKYAIEHDLRPDVITCVILQESGGSPFAFRFEPGFYKKYLVNKTRVELTGWVPGIQELPNLETEKQARATSWGLMQVMGETARWCAKTTFPYLTILCDPEKGIEAGCLVLAYYLNKEKGDYRRALARYNAGSVSVTGLEYADKVLERIRKEEHMQFFKGE